MVYLDLRLAVKRCLGNQGGRKKMDNKRYELNHERTKYENSKKIEEIMERVALLMILPPIEDPPNSGSLTLTVFSCFCISCFRDSYWMSGRRSGTHPTAPSPWRTRLYPCCCLSRPSGTRSHDRGNS